MSTWIVRLDEPGEGPRLAVKDVIDVAGVPTTIGCAAVADRAQPAAIDADCVATARAGGARIVGKSNLHELCYGVTGINRWYGTPVNPLDSTLVPGGSSSGSAAAVGAEEADIGYGTDTGGSVRIPAACCGIAGLKTTWGRISIEGVWPLSPTLDTVGPLARDIAGVVTGMQLMEPGFDPSGAITTVGRVRRPGADPDVEAAVDEVLAAWGVDVIDIVLDGWAAADTAFEQIIGAEAYAADRHWVEDSPDRVGELVTRRILEGAAVSATQLAAARIVRQRWQQELAVVFDRVQILALPTLPGPAPSLGLVGPRPPLNQLTRTFNVSGSPALSLPSANRGTSLQLVGPLHGEELLCAAGAEVERVVQSLRP
ncbi:MAG: amidase [Geodermatophilaceae bacterium]|nr:amidase [Geodermatophilaceae bacterium]